MAMTHMSQRLLRSYGLEGISELLVMHVEDYSRGF